MDLDFIKRAEKVTSFNLTTKDFQSLSYKKEIQHLFNKHFFPEFDLNKTVDKINMSSINSLIGNNVLTTYWYIFPWAILRSGMPTFACHKAFSRTFSPFLANTLKPESKATHYFSASPTLRSFTTPALRQIKRSQPASSTASTI